MGIHVPLRVSHDGRPETKPSSKVGSIVPTRCPDLPTEMDPDWTRYLAKPGRDGRCGKQIKRRTIGSVDHRSDPCSSLKLLEFAFLGQFEVYPPISNQIPLLSVLGLSRSTVPSGWDWLSASDGSVEQISPLAVASCVDIYKRAYLGDPRMAWGQAVEIPLKVGHVLWRLEDFT